MTDEKEEAKFHENISNNELFQGIVTSLKKDIHDVSILEEEEAEKHHHGHHGGHGGHSGHHDKETDEGIELEDER